MKHLRILCCFVSIVFSLTVLYAQDCHWSVNPYDYKYDMTVYAKLIIDDTDVSDYSNYDVGAFIDNECCGTGVVQTKDLSKWLCIRVRSNVANSENIVFYLYDRTTGKESLLKSSQPVTFVSQAMVGLPSNPIALEKPTYMLGDVNEDGIVSVTDAIAICKIIAGDDNADYNKLAADVNGDGIISVTDAVHVCKMVAEKN